MGEYCIVCRTEDLPDGGGKTVDVAGKLIAVFRVGEGYYAIDDVCPHMGASLADGEVESGVVTCPWHAWRFRLADGAWADNPRIKIGCYPVQVSDGFVRILIERNVPIRGANNQEKGTQQGPTP
jgi:NAD(P)H-dependent nitrite reductase small subunit